MGWVFTGASVAGRGKRNADRFVATAIDGVDGPTLLLAVADGAGSARFGHRGGALALQGLTEAVRRSPGAMGYHEVAAWRAAALNAIRTGKRRGADIRDYATTLLAVVVRGDAMAALQIGDGLIMSAAEPGFWLPLFVPARGRYANETWFVTGADAPTKIMLRAAPRAVALCSDGVEPLIHDFRRSTIAMGVLDHLDDALHGAEATERARRRALAGFLRSDVVTSRSGGDDCTLVLARAA